MEAIDQNVYVISLDALDLNLLPTMYDTRDDRIAPLWRISNLDRRNNEYYQFEIKSKEMEESDKDEPPKLQFESIICDICDIKVPKSFLSEHRKSLRHITNMKIADIAIHRMKKYINDADNENHHTDCDEINPSAHFCGICVTVIDSKEKVSHEKSLAHKNSVILEKILYDFLLLYHSHEEIDDGKVNDEAITVKNDFDTKISNGTLNSESNTGNASNNVLKPSAGKVIDKSDEINKMKNKEANKISLSENRNDLDTKISDNMLNSETNTANTSNNIPKSSVGKPIDTSYDLNKMKSNNASKEEAKQMSLSDYLSELNDLIEVPMFFKLNDNNHFIEIETIDGSIVKVKEENFHGFNRVGKKHMQCYVCKMSFKKEVIDKHKMSEEHIQFMITPLEDKHCARKIDNSLSHCLICNTITEYSDLHSLCDKDHEYNLKEALISDKLVEDNQHSHKEIEKDDTAKQVNLTEIEEKGKNNYYQFMKVGKEIGKLNIHHCVKTNESEGSTVIPYKGVCIPCNRWISTFRRLRHNASARHVLNSKSDYHYLMREANELFCIICDVRITNDVGYLKKHVFEKDHIKKYNQILADNKIKQDGDFFYCEACDKGILIKNELLHIDTRSHQAKCFSVEHAVEVSKNIEKENDEISLCNEKVLNNENAIQEHMSSHAINVEKTYSSFDDDDDDDDDDSLIPKAVRDIDYQMETSEFSSFLICRVCKVYIFYDETSVLDHWGSMKHSMKYNELLNNNHLVLNINNCYCNICKVSVGIKCVLVHISGKKHNRMLQQYKLSNNTNIAYANLVPNSSTKEKVLANKQNISNNYMDAPSVSYVKDVNTDMSKNNVDIKNPGVEQEMFALLQPTDNPKEVVCKICKVKVPLNVHNVTTHMNGMKHKHAQITLLQNENPGIQQKMFALLQPTNKPKEVTCKICKVKVPLNVHNVTTHMNGMKHKHAQKILLQNENANK